MDYVVDRIENNIVVCEERKTGKMVNIKKEILPKEVKEGDIIKFENGLYSIDYEETKKEKERIANKFNNILS